MLALGMCTVYGIYTPRQIIPQHILKLSTMKAPSLNDHKCSAIFYKQLLYLLDLFFAMLPNNASGEQL